MALHHLDEEHELPCTEAMLAAVLALMTGYSQSLLAAQPPAQRLAMGTRITEHLAALGDHPALTPALRSVMRNLHRRWGGLSLCSAAALDGADGSPATELPPAWLAAPRRLQ